MAIKRFESLTAMFFEQAAARGDAPFLYAKEEGRGWVPMSWRQVAGDVARLADVLTGLGIRAGDRVVLVSENRPEWFVSDLAIMAAGAISVPTYTTYTERDYLHIIENSGARAAIVSTKALARTFLKAAHQSDILTHAIVIEEAGIGQSLNCEVHRWNKVMANAEPDLEALQARASTITRDDLACLIYTSGTGGAPKGVQLSHGAILSNCEGAAKVLETIGLENNAFLSFLPLSHAYEHTAGQFLPVATGAEIWYAEGLEKLAANLEEAKPTVMVVVPRLFELLRARLMRAIEKEGGLKAKLFDKALELGLKRKRDGQPLSIVEKVIDKGLDLTVRKKVRERFGGRLKALVSGGAPLSPDVGYFFAAFDLPLLQGYGQTEAAPVISVNPPAAPRMHTVGKILDGVEVKIADDGEICVRGELVMKGYWNDEKATNAVIIDGWLHTGDIGRLDEDGYLEITDRKKDIIVNDKGDNVSPQKIEGMLALEDEIAQAMIFGDRRPHLVGLIVPDAEWAREWAAKHGKGSDMEALKADPDFRKAVDAAVARVNMRLSNVEKVRKFAFADEAFSVENEQMTPTLKVRRHIVSKAYKERFEALY